MREKNNYNEVIGITKGDELLLDRREYLVVFNPDLLAECRRYENANH